MQVGKQCLMIGQPCLFILVSRQVLVKLEDAQVWRVSAAVAAEVLQVSLCAADRADSGAACRVSPRVAPALIQHVRDV